MVRVVVFSRQLFLCLAFTVACVICGLGQSDTATLSGRITDPAGLTIGDAAIELVDIDRGTTKQTSTSAVGLYVFPDLKPGHYRLEVSARGFRTVNLTGLTLNVQDNREQNIKMAVGAISESITVQATGSLVEISAAVATNVDRQFVKELPLNGRSFQTLFQLTPGTVIASASFSEQGQFSINGQRANANYFTVDGVSANVGSTGGFSPGQSVGGSLPGLTVGGGMNGLVSVDALQEFSIQTSGYAPEYGRTPGGQISILTRSGTNAFHGTAFDYIRNDLVDANDWFANNLGLKRAALRQNDFGGVLGGPIDRDKTFFFFSYEGLRLRQPKTGISDVPTVAVRQSALPSTRPLLDAFPLPTGPDGGNGLAPGNYAFSLPSGLDAESLRVDHVIGHHLTVFGRYNRSTSSSTDRGGFSLNTGLHNATKLHTATAGLSWLFRPTLANDVRVNWSWSLAEDFITSDSLGGAVPLSIQNFIPADEDAANSTFGIQFFSGNNTTIQAGRLAHNIQRQVNVVDTVSWQIGGHIVRVGIDYRRLTPTLDIVRYTQELTADDPAALAAGNLSAGGPQAVSSFFGPVEAAYANYSLFLQDNWKATHRLTLTYGLRWDYDPAPTAHGANGLPLLTIVGIENLATLAPAPVGTPLYHATRNNIAPRFGLAYGARDSQEYGAVLRAGFGVFYDLGNGPTGNGLTHFPFTQSAFPSPTTFPLSPSEAAAPPPTLASPFGFMNAYPATLRQPYIYHWNVSWEQSLGTVQTLTMSYVAAAGHCLIQQDLIQSGVSSPLSPDFAGILYVSNAGYSNYNSLQLQARRRQAKTLEILGSYTWAHSLDNVSKDSAFSLPALEIVPSLNYGSSDFDIRHTGSLAVDYEIPSFAHAGWVKSLLGGWGLNTFLIARTAPPVEVELIRDLGFGFAAYRPNVAQGISPYLSDSSAPGGTRLNPTAFSVPSAGQGDLRRNALRSFPLFQQDFSIRRNFRLREGLQLQARLEAFNIFNHPNFASFQNLLGFVDGGGTLFPQSNFGLSQSMFATGASDGMGGFNPLYQVGGPRSLQVAMKLEF
jgi:hypothetical protein